MTRKAVLDCRVILGQGKFDFWVELTIYARDTLQTRKSRASHYRIWRNLAWTSIIIISIREEHRSFIAIGLGGTNDRFKVGIWTRKFEFSTKITIFVANYRFWRFLTAGSVFFLKKAADRYSDLSKRQIFGWFWYENGSETCTSAKFLIFGEKMENDERIAEIISVFISSNLEIRPISAKKCQMMSQSRGSFLCRFRPILKFGRFRRENGPKLALRENFRF